MQRPQKGHPYQIVTARWKLLEKNGIQGVYAGINDEREETYSRVEEWGEYSQEGDGLWQASVHLSVP